MVAGFPYNFVFCLQAFFLRSCLLGFMLFLSIFIVIFCRFASYHEARKRIGNIKSLTDKAKFLKQKKALKTTSYVIELVLLFYIPMTVFRLVFVPLISSPETFLAIESFIITLLLCSSAFNPVVYCAISGQYRRAFKKLLHIANNVQPI